MSHYFFLAIFLVPLLIVEAAPIVNYTQTWSKPALTYSIIKPSKTLSLNDTKNVFWYAFSQMSRVISKQFNEQIVNTTTTYPADINIYFTQFDSSNSIGHIISRASNESIYFDDNENWRKYNIGEKIDLKQSDIIWEAMNQIRNLFQINDIPGAENIALDKSSLDSNENYALPRFSLLNRNSTQTMG